MALRFTRQRRHRWQVVAATFFITAGMPLFAAATNTAAEVPAVEGDDLVVDPANATVYWAVAGGRVPLVRLEVQIYPDSWQPRLAVQKSLREARKKGKAVTASYTMGGEYGSASSLEMTGKPAAGGLRITCRARLPQEAAKQAGNKTRVLLHHAGTGPLGRPLDVRRKKNRATLLFGPLSLVLSADRRLVAKYHPGRKYLQVNLTAAGRRHLLGAGLRLDLRCDPVYSEPLGFDLAAPPGRLAADVTAYCAALRMRDIGGAALRAKIAVLEKRVAACRAGGVPSGPDRLACWRRHCEMKGRLAALREEARTLVGKHRDDIYAAAKPQNEAMHYRFGFSTKRGLEKELPKWALFGLNFFRAAPGRVIDAETPAAEAEKFTNLMAAAARFGCAGMVLADGPYQARGPEDKTWTHDFLPSERDSFFHANFNSRRIRDAWRRELRAQAAWLQKIPNVRVIQVGNEPFWDASPNPKVGYNPAEVGCSNATWRKHILARYGDGAAWLAALRRWKTRAEKETPRFKHERFYAGGDFGVMVPWDDFADAGFDPAAIEGLTFVAFLKDRYGTLAALNRAWFGAGRDRYYDRWEQVFPPRPVHADAETSMIGTAGLAERDIPAAWHNAEKAPYPARRDVPAWVDWMEFGGHCVADAERAFRDTLVAAGIRVPVTTNAVMGHYINNFRWNAADVGCYPWITLKGLDAMGIDFYSLVYMQAYIASLRDAAAGRPVYVHEVRFPLPGGRQGAHVAMYCFAHGADALVFFDHRRDFEPHEGLPLLELARALNDADLQHRSRPVVDGVAAIYSLESLFLADARTGSAGPYLEQFQALVTLLDRLQVLFNVYADRQLETAVPEHVRIIAAPGADAVSPALLKTLREWVAGGGVLLTTPDFAARDRFGRPRPANERRWVTAAKGVVMIDQEGLRAWRREGFRDMGRALGWAKPVPPWAASVATVIDDRAPRTVTCRGPDDPLPARKAGARVTGDGVLFVFVDAWAENVRLEVRGRFARAKNLYTGAAVPVTASAGGTVTVPVSRGPAVVRLDPR